jgi:hypothetical protein
MTGCSGAIFAFEPQDLTGPTDMTNGVCKNFNDKSGGGDIRASPAASLRNANRLFWECSMQSNYFDAVHVFLDRVERLLVAPDW